jgi:hypothetical protein
MSKLLYIYDQAIPRVGGRRPADDYIPINLNDKGDWNNDLKAGFDGLLSQNKTFDRVVFTAHGHSGELKIGGRWVSWGHWREYFIKNGHGNYYKLFQPGTRWYFNGCTVADTDAGTEFLAAVGEVFFRHGGVVFGDTGYGLEVDALTTGAATFVANAVVGPAAGIVTGLLGAFKSHDHVVHPSPFNDTKYVWILPGGGRGAVTQEATGLLHFW